MSTQEQEDVTKMIFEDTLLEVPEDVNMKEAVE
jgi:hypothetical protein